MKPIDEYNTDFPLPEGVNQDALNKFMESYPDIEFCARTVLLWPRHPEVQIDLRRDSIAYQTCIYMRRTISYDVLASVTDPTAYVIEILRQAVQELREEAAG